MYRAFRSGNLSLAIALTIAAGLLALPCPARADDGGGISVIGAGQAQTRPSAVEIDATVAGDGELAADATVKYRDTKQKALAAMDALKIPGLTVESQGQEISQAVDPNQQMRMMQGMPADNSKSKVHVSENLKLIIKQADTIDSDKLMDAVLKVLDAARDAGLQVGPPPPSNYIEAELRGRSGAGTDLVTFTVADPTAVRDQAYQQAMADARTKAEKLANLSGVKLGPVISVQEQGGAGGRPVDPTSMMMSMMYGVSVSQPPSDADKGPHSGALHDIPVTVQLSVRFAILPADGK